jgi:hypothetical protein
LRLRRSLKSDRPGEDALPQMAAEFPSLREVCVDSPLLVHIKSSFKWNGTHRSSYRIDATVQMAELSIDNVVARRSKPSCTALMLSRTILSSVPGCRVFTHALGDVCARLLNQSCVVLLTWFRRLNRLRLAQSLQLGYGRAPVLINRLRIRLENARAGMAHYLGDKERRDARFR